MHVYGMLRVRNEARWIERVIKSILPICERAFVLDDHSTDATPEICSSFDAVTVFESPFEGLDETRDKTYLLEQMRANGVQDGDYVLAIDGDEELENGGAQKIWDLLAHRPFSAYHLRVLYLWNDRNTVRMDGVYGRFYRPSLFRLEPFKDEYRSTTANGNLHCTNIPADLIGDSRISDISLLHYGYIDPEIRARKFAYYNSVDPGNANEDFYKHITQGDAGGAPAHVRLLHAGPLKLEHISF